MSITLVWVLGIELRSLCLQGKNFVTEPPPNTLVLSFQEEKGGIVYLLLLAEESLGVGSCAGMLMPPHGVASAL